MAILITFFAEVVALCLVGWVCLGWDSDLSVLDNLFRSRVIAPDCPEGKQGAPLLKRYFVFQSKRLGIYIHYFYRSDMDDFHDHPWTFISIPLSSGYFEHVPRPINRFIGLDLRYWRPRFLPMYRPARWKHWVEVLKPTWTLVIRFRRQRDWGYWPNGKWLHWQVFDKQSKARAICEDE